MNQQPFHNYMKGNGTVDDYFLGETFIIKCITFKHKKEEKNIFAKILKGLRFFMKQNEVSSLQFKS